MLRGHWRYIAAVVGLVGIGGLGYGGNQLYQAAEQHNSDYDYQPASHPGILVLMPGKTPAKAYQPNCKNPQDNNKADLCAQWAAVQQVSESNRIASFNLRLAIASLWATIIATGLLIWNLIETRETSRKQLRAYLSMQITVPFYDVRTGIFKINHGFTNCGQTPAYHFRSMFKWDIFYRTVDETAFTLSSAVLDEKPRTTLGAGLDNLTPLDLMIPAGKIHYLRTGEMEIFVFGCAFFSDVFGREHYVKFRRRLYKDGGFGHFYAVPAGEDST